MTDFGIESQSIWLANVYQSYGHIKDELPVFAAVSDGVFETALECPPNHETLLDAKRDGAYWRNESIKTTIFRLNSQPESNPFVAATDRIIEERLLGVGTMGSVMCTEVFLFDPEPTPSTSCTVTLTNFNPLDEKFAGRECLYFDFILNRER